MQIIPLGKIKYFKYTFLKRQTILTGKANEYNKNNVVILKNSAVWIQLHIKQHIYTDTCSLQCRAVTCVDR
jgi:hypothetical protein